jgi:flagellum-specific ATP synthase
MNEPIADAARSILDGHVVLTRSLAHAGHYPAIDVLQSVSRLVGEVVSPEIGDAGRELRSLLAAHRDKADLIAVGAYERGADPLADRAIELKAAIDAFLRQPVEDATPGPDADARLLDLLACAPAELAAVPTPAPRAPGPSAIPPLNIAV